MWARVSGVPSFRRMSRRENGQCRTTRRARSVSGSRNTTKSAQRASMRDVVGRLGRRSMAALLSVRHKTREPENAGAQRLHLRQRTALFFVPEPSGLLALRRENA
ncbi:hypothetical protein MRX96_056311 [Rhipicephalus microplus]